ncbi:hypothetical protein OIU84_026962 [Salix udensis]|uniref:Uncharacterized protein n=1 Tax=Salix udensis TaxID=889485 RepID=A0AAD6PAB1_9ROSI|nr:hypothetical protein OIU84_026962 [Salix udensis]
MILSISLIYQKQLYFNRLLLNKLLVMGGNVFKCCQIIYKL